jgi:hypothetical protein
VLLVVATKGMKSEGQLPIAWGEVEVCLTGAPKRELPAVVDDTTKDTRKLKETLRDYYHSRNPCASIEAQSTANYRLRVCYMLVAFASLVQMCYVSYEAHHNTKTSNLLSAVSAITFLSGVAFLTAMGGFHSCFRCQALLSNTNHATEKTLGVWSFLPAPLSACSGLLTACMLLFCFHFMVLLEAIHTSLPAAWISAAVLFPLVVVMFSTLTLTLAEFAHDLIDSSCSFFILVDLCVILFGIFFWNYLDSLPSKTVDFVTHGGSVIGLENLPQIMVGAGKSCKFQNHCANFQILDFVV